jgi:hypothetical protein
VRAIDLLARTEGLIADPVYEGKAIRGLVERIRCGRLPAGRHVLLLHMGGTPAVHGYADQLRRRALTPTRTMLDAESAVPLKEFAAQLAAPLDRARCESFEVCGVIRGGSTRAKHLGVHVWLGRRFTPGPAISVADDTWQVPWPPTGREVSVFL